METHNHTNNEERCLDCNSQNKCDAAVEQCVAVHTPIRLEVASEPTDMEIECGIPRICSYSKPRCCRKSSREFVVKQFLCVKIPISYTVKADMLESYIECNKDSL